MIEYKMPYQLDRKQDDLVDGREITAAWNYFREYQVEQHLREFGKGDNLICQNILYLIKKYLYFSLVYVGLWALWTQFKCCGVQTEVLSGNHKTIWCPLYW